MDVLPRKTLELVKKHGFKSMKIVNMDLDEELDCLPFGSDFGQLENGLTYYVRCNPKPQMRAALALAVKVGSVFEQETERGVAHIVEHLAFSATKKYSNHDIVKFLESIGAEFGACGNAYTSTDETVYELFVPIDKPGVLSEAISILSEFSSEIRISSEDLEKERGAVLEEYREGRDASGRLDEACWTSILEGSKYAERLPIGLENVIQSVPSEVAKQFYKKWYHLQNMAVIAVGDFPDTESVIKLIKEHFGQISSAVDPPLAPVVGVPTHDEPRYLCLAESEAGGTTVQINWKMPNCAAKTVRDYRDWLIGVMFSSALNRRFSKIARGKDPPYFSCCGGEAEWVCPRKAFQITSTCRERGTIEALESMLTELARVRLHGFSEHEISIARLIILSEIESAYLERDQQESSAWRYQYLQHFLRSEAVLGVEFEAKLCKSILPQISASEVTDYSKKLRTSGSCVIITTEPRATVTSEDLCAVALRINYAGAEGQISAWNDDFVTEKIVQMKPNPGHIVQQSEYPDIGVTELILSNGMKVCYKCTDFKNDQVIFEGFSYGGFSELRENEYLSCIMGPAIAEEIGMFGYKPTVLEDMLAGKRANVTTDLGLYSRTFSGDCSPTDLETALQLVYQLFLTNVEPDEGDIKRVMHIIEENIRARERDPYTAFWSRVNKIKYGNSYFLRPVQINDLPKVNPQKACEYFSNCFKDPSDFTVVVVGNIDPAIAQLLILEYLGGIPKPADPIFHFDYDDIKALPCTSPMSTVREIVRSPMVEAQCSVHISFNVKIKSETMMEEMCFIGFLTQLLQTKLTQVLRFKHGKIYSASVSSDFGYSKPSRTKDLHGDITVDFSCDPNVSATLVDVVLAEMQRLQENGPSEEDISAVLEIDQRDYENALQENTYWLFQIFRSYYSRFYSGDVNSVFQALDKARNRVRKSLSPLTAKWALQSTLPYPCKKHFIALTLIPETNPLRLLQHQLKTQFKQMYYGRYAKKVDKVWKNVSKTKPVEVES